MNVVSETHSVCPDCLKVIPARLVVEDGKVHMEKTCRTHGDFQALIWSDYEMYRSAEMSNPIERKKMDNNCPLDCGLCPSHAQHTCLAVIEVTNSCDLRCRICFASSGRERGHQPDLGTISEMFEAILKSEGGPQPVQLSGGEPLTRKDLPEIVQIGRELGFDHIEVNTNGVALAKNPQLARSLAESGVSTVYLQFDGLDDKIYSVLRGARLLGLKLNAIENCKRNDIAVILVPTIVKGVNDDQLGAIIKFAMREENVKGINFQPVALMGRYPPSLKGHKGSRTTIPDLIRAMEGQTNGSLTKEDFYSIPCPHPHCSALTLALVDGDRLVPLPRLIDVKSAISLVRDPASAVSKVIARLWSVSPEEETREMLERLISTFGLKIGGMEPSKILSISMMAFQDCWTLDIERLQRCCVHVVTSDGRFVPFCAYYLTSTDGRQLYRDIHAQPEQC
ncbi:MAG: radical SAM protein [Candidatus Bathyarchaeia archaeon]